MKKLLWILITVLLLTGCTQEEPALSELWVVTEQNENMNVQAELVIEQFEAAHPGITVKLEIIPTAEESREAYLQKLRSQVMSGKGPDVYLMPTAAQKPPEEDASTTGYLEPLYCDVKRQMYYGIFADISEFYDADTELHTGELVTAVMDAGTMDGARYVLPLRYTLDMILVDVDAMEEMGLDAARLEGGLDELYRFALDSGDELIAHALNLTPHQALLESFVDPFTDNVTMDAQAVAELITLWKQVEALENIEAHQDVQEYYNGIGWVTLESGYPHYDCSISHYINNHKALFSNSGYLLYSASIHDCVELAAVIRQSGENIAMYPVRAMGGDVVAEVVYYGAVGVGCQDAELAYEFLRLFLTEDIQWEQYAPWNQSHSSGNVYSGFPVRALGAAEPLYENIRRRLDRAQKIDQRMHNETRMKLRAPFIAEDFTVTGEDIPILSTPIDRVVFPVTDSCGDAFDRHIPALKATDDLTGTLDAIIQQLQWTLSES